MANGDTLTSGLHTTYRPASHPPALHVDWIDWDSSFRGTGLRVGDDIVAIDGVPVDAAAGTLDRSRFVGQDQQSSGFAARGLRDGDPLRLTAQRRRIPGEGWETVAIEGRVRAEQSYTDAEGRPSFGPGGPPRLARDGFSDSWASWYENRKFEWERQLDGGVWYRSGASRQELARHFEAEPRVRRLAELYPGPFAEAVVADWQAVRDSLVGRRYEVEPEEYDYRGDEDVLVATVTSAGRAAWDAFVATRAGALVPAPGPLNLVSGDQEKLAGKLLQLPPAGPQAWIADVGGVVVSWRQNGGWVFTRLESPQLHRLWRAQFRYRRKVTPVVADEFSMIGRVLPETLLVAPKDQAAVIGLEVEPQAALMGRGEAQFFVDLTAEQGGEPTFAGEDGVRVLPSELPPDEASPRAVLEALIAALYARDDETWFALFADWHFASDEGRPFYYPFYPYPESHRDADWNRSRRVVLEQTFAIRVVWVGEPRVVAADELPDIPRIERVAAELDHIGSFDAEYRAFASVDVHRHWTLERRDGGPWRITSHQGI
jgi:hypothetical protein